MAGRSKITDRKIKNLELGKIDQIISDKVDVIMDKKHPFALLDSDIEARDALMDLPLEEFKRHLESNLRLLSDKALHRMINELEKVPTHRLPALYSIINDAMVRIQGEPTQRIEVTKKGLSPEQFSELIKKLPKQVEVEEINDEPVMGRKNGSSGQLGPNASHLHKTGHNSS